MSCKVGNSKIYKWKIPKEIINNILRNLYKDHEVAGILNLMDRNVVNYTEVKGEKDSVEAPKAIANYHTHPVHCYKTEKVIWGWPSGEDIRESILSTIKGSVAHAVPSVEGTYVIQINPCIIENLCHISGVMTDECRTCMKLILKDINKNKNSSSSDEEDLFRGLIILIIEIYFKSTHVFRSYEYNKLKGDLTPKDFVIFSNVFTLKNIFQKNVIKGCSNLKCNSVWTFENKNHEKLSFLDYVKDYENDPKEPTNIYLCSKDGNAIDTRYSFYKILKKFNKCLTNTFENLSLGSNCKFPKKLWIDHWILISFEPNEVFFNGSWKPYIKLSNDECNSFINKDHTEIDIRPINDSYFHFFDISNDCTYNDLSKIIIHKNKKCNENSEEDSEEDPEEHIDYDVDIEQFEGPNDFDSYILIGSPNCGYCVSLKEKLNQYNIEYKYIERESIADAIKESTKYKKDNDSIPLLIDKKTMKVVDHNKL